MASTLHVTVRVSEHRHAAFLFRSVTAMTRFRALLATGCLLVAGCTAKGHKEATPALAASAGAPSGSASAEVDAAEYPRGTWRTDPSSLDHVVVSISQILIAYKGATIDPASRWSAKTAPERTREEARSLAVHIASALRSRPEEVGSMVQRYSEEPESRGRKGWTGAWRAADVPTLAVDAYLTLKEGEISHAFQTDNGFHVIKRVKLPADQNVAVDEIVIVHKETPVLPWLRPGRQDTRARAEALDLAQRVLTLARPQPNSFAKLVDEYSDGLSAVDGGDRGTWPWYEPSVNPAAFAAVDSVPVGQVTDIEEDGGTLRIFRRKEAREPTWVSTQEIVVTHSSSVVGISGAPSKRSRKEALALATRVLRELKQAPSRFESLREKYCDHVRCKEPIRLIWMPGNGIPGFDRAVGALQIGQIADTPLETPYGFHVVRRIELPAAESLPQNEHLVFEVPKPPPRTVDFFFDRAPSDVLAGATLAFKPEAIRGLGLSGEKADTFSKILDDLAEAIHSGPLEKRSEIRESTKQALTRVLGESGYSKYCSLRDAWVLREQKKL